MVSTCNLEKSYDITHGEKLDNSSLWSNVTSWTVVFYIKKALCVVGDVVPVTFCVDDVVPVTCVVGDVVPGTCVVGDVIPGTCVVGDVVPVTCIVGDVVPGTCGVCGGNWNNTIYNLDILLTGRT
ncbi:hypothetical protein LOTGIDRAFT_167301 [Lottia gigantea]|uniref:Uncharacterized protein n=1 Tax=Lottia gigantea TaxID=225164 RepID=V3ZUJ9_LOTGI|nr:hypothetical protein LOTGIDRAFT_167301 [Lottia gigantea]ESO86255.1 hypothetical protein LOTGIDRAFT_167301 [Lottia gigantea]